MSSEFTAAHIARLVGMTSYALLQSHPDDFGAPGHYRMQGASVIYTARGVKALADDFRQSGKEQEAQLLDGIIENAESMAPLPVPVGADGPHNWALDWERNHDL